MAAKGAVAAKFRSAGQACVAANRYFVHSSVLHVFLEKLTVHVRKVKLSNAIIETRSDELVIGPLISPKAVEKVARLLDSGRKAGGEIVYGGSLDEHRDTAYFPPTIMLLPSNSKEAKRIFDDEEIFGPLIVIQTFDAFDDVIARANVSNTGLSAYVYSRDYSSKALLVHSVLWFQLHCANPYCIRMLARSGAAGSRDGRGMYSRAPIASDCLVNRLNTLLQINSPVVSNAIAPFGGVKQSGFGREGMQYFAMFIYN